MSWRGRWGGALQWWGILSGLLGVVWAVCAAGESLWLDELHTSWAVSGAWSDVADRAAQGNQSPLYFWGLFGLTKTLGNLGGFSGELQLRLPSILCWGVTLIVAQIVCQRATHATVGSWSAWGVAAALPLWLLLDRIQLFYATEARVYAAVQLVSLLGWMMVARVDEPHRRWLWCGLSVLLMFVHITAVLAVIWQIVYGTWLVSKHPRSTHNAWVLAVSIVALALVIALFMSGHAWEHRQRWSSFAGDASLDRLLTLFPLAAYIVPVLVMRSLDRLLCGSRTSHTTENIHGSPNWLWLMAAAGPWLSAWAITALQIAPVFHRRFVIVAAIPLVLWAVLELGRVRHWILRWLGVAAVGVWLIVAQGTLHQWIGGQIFGWQRTEGWRQASVFLREQVQPGDRLWCASGLIEGHGAELPLGDTLDRYLSFPLRGLYRVSDANGVPLAPHALVADGASWHAQLGDVTNESSGWIVYRGSPGGFDNQLRLLRLQWEANSKVASQIEIDQPRAFGLVSLARVRWH